MLRNALGLRRSVVLLGAGVLAGVVLTGCAGATPTRTVTAAATATATDSSTPDSSTPDSSTDSSTASSTASSTPDSALTPGLLSAGDLGAQDVHQFSLDGNGDSDHHGPWGWWGDGDGDAQVTPSACTTAVQDATSGFPDLQDGVGQVARVNDVRTFEALAVPTSPVKAVDALRALMNACDGASVTWNGDGHEGSMTVSIDEISGALEHTAAFSVTVSGQRSDSTWTTTALVGVGDDGNRVLGLAQMSWDQSLDQAAFTDLLEKAYQTQADALD